jgi:predicted  nucleic acid-binding Zn-ribbon protein
LKNLDIERAESRVALETALVENQVLKDKLTATEAAVTSLQKNLAAVSGEAEVFRRKANELNIRLEALGAGKLDDRLVKLLNDLKVGEEERARLRDALIGLTESVSRYEKVALSSDAAARLELEAAMRDARKALGVAPPEAISAPQLPSSLTEGMVVSIKEELALIVSNLGSRHGVKVGMAFDVIRGDSIVGSVRTVDVRERISGALIQNLSDKEKIKVGDRLRVAVQP